MFKQVPLDTWQKGLDEPFAMIKWKPDDVFFRDIEFSEDTWDLGEMLIALFEDPHQRQFGLMHALQVHDHGTDILFPRKMPGWESYLFEVLDFLKLDRNDLSWIRASTDLTQASSWNLCRLDDNGNEFVMATYGTEGKAKRLMQEYEARGHKQTYWVEEMAHLSDASPALKKTSS